MRDNLKIVLYWNNNASVLHRIKKMVSECISQKTHGLGHCSLFFRTRNSKSSEVEGKRPKHFLRSCRDWSESQVICLIFHSPTSSKCVHTHLLMTGIIHSKTDKVYPAVKRHPLLRFSELGPCSRKRSQ